MKPIFFALLMVITACSTGPEYSRNNPFDGLKVSPDETSFSWNLDAQSGEFKGRIPIDHSSYPESEIHVYENLTNDSTLLGQFPLKDIAVLQNDSAEFKLTDNAFTNFPTTLSLYLNYDNESYYLTRSKIGFSKNDIKLFRLFTSGAVLEIDQFNGLTLDSNKQIESIGTDPMGINRYFAEVISNITFTPNASIISFGNPFRFNESISFTISYPRKNYSIDTTVSVASDKVFIEKVVNKLDRPFAELSIKNEWFATGFVGVFMFSESSNNFLYTNELIRFVDPMEVAASSNPFTPIDPVEPSGFYLPENQTQWRYKFIMISGNNRSILSPESKVTLQGESYVVEFNPE